MTLWSNVDETSGKPKNLSSTEKSATVGIDATEAAANGLTAGWNLKTVGTGGRAGRVFHEVLVALGSISGDNDTVDPDPVITIGTQPSNISVTANSQPAIFSVEATVTRGAVLSYQWQWVDSANSENPTPTWNNVSMGTGETTATYNAGTFGVGDTGARFRCVVSAVGATSVISSVATLTVTE